MICPRCDDDRAAKIFEAPEDASWEVYRCPRCYFTWRNTEEDEVTNPDLYDPRFKLSGEKTKRAAVTRALEEFIARREQRRLLELFGKLRWNPSYDYKAERSRN